MPVCGNAPIRRQKTQSGVETGVKGGGKPTEKKRGSYD